MYLAIVLLVSAVLIPTILKIFFYIMQKDNLVEFSIETKLLDMKPDMTLNMDNAEKFDIMTGNLNSPVRNDGEGFYDGILRELVNQRDEKVPEKNILQIVSRKMEKN